MPGWWLSYQTLFHHHPLVFWESIGVPFLHLQVCEVSVTSRLKWTKCLGRNLKDGRELWTGLRQQTFSDREDIRRMVAGD